MSDNFIKKAYEEVIQDHQKINPCYVVLWKRVPFYGGPEEGGWWGEDIIPEAYHACDNDEIGYALEKKVRNYAEFASKEAKRKFGEYCLSTMAQLEARGLDAEYLPEPDGEESYFVTVQPDFPKPSYGSRHWD